jgi:hypothetical protein
LVVWECELADRARVARRLALRLRPAGQPRRRP